MELNKMEKSPSNSEAIMPNLEELNLEQLQALKKTLEEAEKKKINQQKASVIADIKTKVNVYGITINDVFGKIKEDSSKSKGEKNEDKTKRPITHLNPDTGTQWTGRGPKPKEFRDMSPEQLGVYKLEKPIPNE
jgi:DNA-binding protein H-NS